MSGKNSPLVDLPELPDSIDTAVKNLSDKPTQGIGQTLSDVWYLVFGGISQTADKRRMKYAHDLELYKQELSQAISSIPEESLIEPNIQITAQALENSKYCIESEELRKLFVNLISKSADSHYASNAHPSFAEIIKQMSPLDAKILKSFHPEQHFPLVDYVLKDYSNNSFKTLISNVYIPPFSGVDLEQVCTSISSLKRLGIIEIVTDIFLADASLYEPFKETSDYQALSVYAASFRDSKKLETKNYLGYLTPLGENFYEVCVK